MTGGSTYFERRLARRMQDPAFQFEYQQASREIEQTMAVLHALDSRREEVGISKAELARKIGKRPEAVRRLFSAGGNPELNTVAAMAAVLGGEVRTVFPTPSRQEVSSPTTSAAVSTRPSRA
ncbi:MAG: helix-turn-helix domain-containing protein [Candidatus Dormibacteria bacterium]